MGTLLQDLRFAFRQLSRAKSFTVTAVLTLALGIGANTAIFSLVNSLLLKPLPVPNPGQISTLVLRENNGSMQQQFSWPEYKAIRAASGKSFSAVFAHNLGLDGLSVEGKEPDRILTAYVSGNFFEGLALKPAEKTVSEVCHVIFESNRGSIPASHKLQKQQEAPGKT